MFTCLLKCLYRGIHQKAGFLQARIYFCKKTGNLEKIFEFYLKKSM